MRKHFIYILILMWVGVQSNSCKKEKEFHHTDVVLLSPKENSLLMLPDTLLVEFTITADKYIDFAAISIVNKNYTPLFGTEYIDEPKPGKLFSKSIIVNALQYTEENPYYILITIGSGGGMDNYYFKVRLANRSLSYRGFYAFVKTSVHTTTIDYYNRKLEKTPFTVTDGDYLDSDISGFSGKLYLLTTKPEKLLVFDLMDQQLVWETEPLMPYPVYTDIYADEGRIYAAMGNGQISGYAGLNGQLQYVTERLKDSLPGKMVVVNDYLVAYYRSRLNARKSLVSFFLATGVKKQQYPINFEVLDLFKDGEPDKTVVFGNSNGNGVSAVFSPQENYLEQLHNFGFGTIEAVCRSGDDTFVILTGNRLFLYDRSIQQDELLKIWDDSVSGIKYERATNRLFLLFSDRVDIYSFPEMQQEQSVEFNAVLKGIEFYCQYE